jgi:uncharacterized membrane protein
MALDSDKTLGGIGAILIVVGMIIPFLGIIGIIMVLIAMRGLAEYYGDPSIFKDALYALIFGIIGIIVLGSLIVSIFFVTNISSVTTTFPTASILPSVGQSTGATLSIVGILIAAVIALFIFYLLEAIFMRRAFDKLADKSGEGIFRTAGLLLLIGAVLTIILIGLVLIFVAWILAIVGYFGLKPKAQPTTAPPSSIPPLFATPPPPQPAVGRKYCPNCGAENAIDAGYCVKCGNKL